MFTKIRFPAVVLVSLAFIFSATSAIPSVKKFKNIIIIVADGCGISHATITRWYKYPRPMAIDNCNVSLVHTWGANSLITDSAPAATAFACGQKAFDKAIGVLPPQINTPGIDTAHVAVNGYRPVANILEGARLSGRQTGMVATSWVQHATPAAFSSHVVFRDLYATIAAQQVYQNIDVVLGGGEAFLVDTATRQLSDSLQKGARHDGVNLRDTLIAHGYSFLSKKSELAGIVHKKGQKIWGAFAPHDLAYDLDRTRFSPQQPSLSEMTQKAIDLLAHNPKGFFLFVEASKIDWASHANEAVGVVSDYAAFDDALKAATDFAKKDGNTLVLAFSDHDNGGMTLGRGDVAYSSFPYSTFIDPFTSDSLLTAPGVEKLLLENKNIRDSIGITRILSTYYGLRDLNKDEHSAIMNHCKQNIAGLSGLIAPMFSKRAGIGWSTGGHDGTDIPLFYYGIEKLPAFIDNTDIAKLCASSMGFNLPAMTQRLYCPADSLFPKATITIDSTIAANGETFYKTCVIKDSTKTVILPINSNTLICNGSTYSMEGITVYIPQRKTPYIPMQVKKMCKRK